jgi:hypothetical protein
MTAPRTYAPNPNLTTASHDDEEPCIEFFHSHSATFVSGRVVAGTAVVPYVARFTSTEVFQSAS